MKLLSTTIAILAAAGVNAQTVSESGSSSQSNSGVVFGDNYAPLQAPSAVAPGNMHTAPCIVGSSAGIGIPGIGLSGGGGRLEQECNTREEVKALNILLSQPPSVARTASLLHYCNNDSSIRKTLVSMGICVRSEIKEVRKGFEFCQQVGPDSLAVWPTTKAALKACRKHLKSKTNYREFQR